MKIKYALSLILVIVMLFTAAVPIFALKLDVDVNDSGKDLESDVSYVWDSVKVSGDGDSKETDVEVVMTQHYEINIPARVTLIKGTSTKATVAANNVVIEREQSLVFKVSSKNYDNGWTLVGEEGNKHPYSIKLGDQEVANNGTVLSCPGGTNSKEATLAFAPVGAGRSDIYTDTLTFSISVQGEGGDEPETPETPETPEEPLLLEREVSYMNDTTFNKVKGLLEECTGPECKYWMNGAPYTPRDKESFKGKKLASISIPVYETLEAVNGYFTYTIYVFEDSLQAIENSTHLRKYQLKISAKEYGLPEKTVGIYKFIEVDVKDKNIVIGENEIIAFSDTYDTIIPAYANGGAIYDFYKEEFPQFIGFSFMVGRSPWNPSTTDALIYNFKFAESYADEDEYYQKADIDEMIKAVKNTYGGLNFSVFGDGISTLDGISNNTKYNDTIGSNLAFYGNNASTNGAAYAPITVGDTYWGRMSELAKMNLCVNNSSCSLADSYLDRVQELHNIADKNPDLILAYFGINEAMGTDRLAVGELTALLNNRGSKNEFDVIREWLDATVADAANYDSFDFDQMYAYLLYLMTEKYDDAKIVCISLVSNALTKENSVDIDEYNFVIEALAKYFGAIYVDQGNVINDDIRAVASIDEDQIYLTSGAHRLIFEEIIRMLYAEIVADPDFDPKADPTEDDDLTDGYTVESTYVPESTMDKLVATFETKDEAAREYVASVAPFTFNDIESFKGKRLTSISIPVMRTTTIDANGCFTFTLSVFKSDFSFIENSNALRTYKIKIPAAENGLKPNTADIYKFVTVDLREYDIVIAEDELLAFGTNDANNLDTLIPAYIADNDLESPVGRIMKKEFPQMCGFSQQVGRSAWNPNGDYSNSLLFGFTFETTYASKAAYRAVLAEEADFEEMLEAVKDAYSDKKLSVFGDSISTFTGISTNTNYNTTIGGNAVWYDRRGTGGLYDYTYTYWGNFIRLAGMELCVNNAWSGDSLSEGRFRTRAVNLHNDTGVSSVNPEVIFVYFGINDTYGSGRPVDDWKPLYDELLSLITKKYYGAKLVCVGLTTNYGKADYPNADILVPQYNKAIRELCKKYSAIYVDQEIAINSSNYQSYMHDDRVLHPNAAGHELIFKQIVKALYADLVKDSEDDNSSSQKPGDQDTSLKILTIGNSFSDDTMEYMYQIAKASGYTDITLGNLYIGGCTLATHAKNAKENKGAYEYRRNNSGTWATTPGVKMGDAIKEQQWDIISLQQASGSSGKADTYGDLDYLLKYVRSLAPDSELVWNMTWAYQQNSDHSEFSKYNKSQSIMYQSILSAVREEVLPKSEISLVVPNGTAIQNARTSYIGDTLTRDGYHLTYDMGRYIAGLTFFYAVTGRSIKNVPYAPVGIDENLKKIAIESAVNAVNSPWNVSESKYSEIPMVNLDDYKTLDIQWIPLGYWLSNSSNNYDKVITLEVAPDALNTEKWYASSVRFTKETLPVGSVIVLNDGWAYRPDAWTDEGKNTGTRPEMVYSKRIVITEEWWGDYIYRAFNLTKVDGSSLENVSAEEIENAFTIYLPELKAEKYYTLNMGWTSLGYWNSTDSTNYGHIITGADNSSSYYASIRFTRDTLPVGSVIILKSGWIYRPDGWTNLNGAMGYRPENVITQIVEITEEWWGDYEYRAFNLSKADGTSLAGVSADEIKKALSIYVPNDSLKPGEDKYEVLDMQWQSLCYWNSNHSSKFDRLIDDESNSHKFSGSARFDRESLPVGSIIVVNNGWAYRPDGWTNLDTSMPSRPLVADTNTIIVVTEEWWANYVERGFNLWKTDESSLVGVSLEEIRDALTIYVPYCASPSDHNYVEISRVDALALKDGEVTYECAHCRNATRTEKISATKSLKILAIGNSFTQDSTTHLWGICNDAGVEELVVANLYTGNCSLNTHWNNISNGNVYQEYQYYTSATANVSKNTHTMEMALLDEDWDFIVLHQTSGSTGQDETFEHLEDIIAYVKGKVPNAELLWHMTWAYDADNTHSEYWKYDNDQMTMYNAMLDRVKETILPLGVFADIIPNATSIQNLRTSYIGDNVTRDGYHLDYGFGRYTAALTWYAILTGGDVDVPDWVPAAYPEVEFYLPVIRESVKAALANNFEITESTFKTPEQEIDLGDYELLEWDYVTNGFWNCASSTTITNPASTDANNYNKNICVDRMYSIDELPVGTIFVCDYGWRFRLEQFPDADQTYTGTRHSGHVKPYFVLTESFIKNCNYLAWSVSADPRVDISDKFDEAASHVRIYVPKINLDEYVKLDLEWTMGYWYPQSASNYNQIITSAIAGASNTDRWYATNIRFTKETLPVGSIITLDNGWAYRPACWTADATHAQSDMASLVYATRFVVTEDWWQKDKSTPYIYRAFNLCMEGGNPPPVLSGMSYDDVVKHINVYIPKDKYEELDMQWVRNAYWQSDRTAGEHKTLVTTASNSDGYCASGVRFTKEDIPVGSVIVLNEGWKYRPEGWTDPDEKMGSRPDIVTSTTTIFVDEEWWEDYTVRAFHIWKTDGTKCNTWSDEEILSALTIYVPKSQ